MNLLLKVVPFTGAFPDQVVCSFEVLLEQSLTVVCWLAGDVDCGNAIDQRRRLVHHHNVGETLSVLSLAALQIVSVLALRLNLGPGRRELRVRTSVPRCAFAVGASLGRPLILKRLL